MNIQRFMPPAVMVRGIITSLFLIAAMFCAVTSALAVEQALGTFGGVKYEYADSTVKRDGDTVSAFMISYDQKFNYKHSQKYLAIGRRYAMSCNNATYTLFEIAVINTDHTIAKDMRIPIDKLQVVSLANHISQFYSHSSHIPQDALYRALCYKKVTI